MKNNFERTTRSRLKVALAGLALAGAIVGGAIATDQTDVVGSGDTTESAWNYYYSWSGTGLSWR